MAQPDPNTLHSGDSDAFTQRVQTLTRLAANDITPAHDAWNEIELRLRQQETSVRGVPGMRLPGRAVKGRTSFDGWSGARPLWGALSVVVVVSLLLGAYSWIANARPIGGDRMGNPLAHAQATVHGVTIKVDSVYADATRTVVSYQVVGLTPQQGSPVFFVPVLLDSHGRVYLSIAGAAPDLVHGANFYVFSPLPSDGLARPQVVTFYVDQLLFPPIGASTQDTTLVGPWKIAAPITPQAGVVSPAPGAAITHNGISVRLEHVQWAPTDETAWQVDGNYDTLGVILRISGLPSDANALLDVQSNYLNDGGGGSMPSSSTATVQVGDGSELTPALVYQITPQVQVNGIHYYITQGAATTGSVEVGISFLASLPITPAPFTFTLHDVQYERDTGSQGASQVYVVPGDWVFHVA